jgi:hypothetical protein
MPLRQEVPAMKIVHFNRNMAMVITTAPQKMENDNKKPHTISMVHGL